VEYLREAYRKGVKYPIVIGLPVTAALVGQAYASLGARTMNSPDAFGVLIASGLLLAFLSPAVASGYGAVVGAAAKDRGPSFSVFISNLSTYYWRIFGAAIAAGIVFSLLLGRLYVASMGAGGAQGPFGPSGPPSWPLLLAGLVSELAIHLWFAALVLDGCTSIQAVGLAWRSVSGRPRDYGALAAASVGAGILLALLGRVLPSGLQPIHLVLAAAVTGYFRLAAFLTYDGAFAASLPGSDGLKPPLYRPSA